MIARNTTGVRWLRTIGAIGAMGATAVLGAPMLDARSAPPPPALEDLVPIVLNFGQAAKGLQAGQTAVYNACLPKDQPERLGRGPCAEGRELYVPAKSILSITAWTNASRPVLLSGAQYIGPNAADGADHDRRNLVTGIPRGALLCRLWDDAHVARWQFCGRVAYGQVGEGGSLQFAINDRDQVDIAGEFRISVAIGDDLYASERPPWIGQDDETWSAQFANLPDCYCDAFAVPGSGREGRGRWDDLDRAKVNRVVSGGGHPGATIDYRWTPDDDAEGKAGQQCVYDSRGRLINRGVSAGTPDRVAPRTLLRAHGENDVLPFEHLPVSVYLQRWQPNRGDRRLLNERIPGRKAVEHCPLNPPPLLEGGVRDFAHLM